MENLNIKEILEKIETQKKIIAISRDKLHDIYSELEDLLESFDSGIEGLESGKLELEGAIDKLSEQI